MLRIVAPLVPITLVVTLAFFFLGTLPLEIIRRSDLAGQISLETVGNISQGIIRIRKPPFPVRRTKLCGDSEVPQNLHGSARFLVQRDWGSSVQLYYTTSTGGQGLVLNFSVFRGGETE